MNNTITLDSTGCKTTLCDLCSKFGTDKSPFTQNGGHRHPYTTPYSLMLEPLKHKAIKLAEFGVFRGASLIAWRLFFSRARIFGFDCDEPGLDYIRSMNMGGVIVDKTDCGNSEPLIETLKKYTSDNELFDVIIDDASHNVGHQALMIKTALPYLKVGGILIIEDIFRDAVESPLIEAMESVKDLISFQTFVVCDHADRFSPGWNNDKMLIIVRNSA